MQETRFPTHQLVITILLASILSTFSFLTPQTSQALAAPASQTLPTAEPCQPAVLEPTSSVINARTGPGPNYPILGELAEGQAYTVAGRHHGFNWWAVTLSDGVTGWVWDDIVVVSGNVDAVPLLDAPALNGVVPDTDEDWTPISASPPCEATAEVQPAQEATPPISVSNRLQNEWETPVNLSMSGGATDPTIIMDEAGSAHAIWQEEIIESFVYSQGPTDWSPPVPLELPFGTRLYYPELQSDDATPLFTPELVTGGDGRIHALWIDDDGTLYHSSVASEEFANFGSWSQRVPVAESVVTLDSTVDASQTIHVTYARSQDTEDQPSGLYYLLSRDGGVSWSIPVLLHQTRYFRTLSSSELSVSITVSGIGDQASVFVTWDNRILDRVFLVRSLDGGASWTGTLTIDSREIDDPPDAVGPAQIVAQTHGDQLHLLWRAGHEAQSCGLYHQWSGDDGETWQSRQLLPVETPTCPLRSQFLTGSEGLLFMLTVLEQQGIMLAWDGERWSDPEPESTLASFIDDETRRRIVFGWNDTGIDADNRLLVIGAEESDYSDIWLISRPLGDAEEWFPPPTPWSPPLTIANTKTAPTSPLLVAGADGRLHGFWIQRDSLGRDGSAIYYVQREEDNWSRPSPILSSSQDSFRSPSAAVTQSGRIFLIWQSSDGTLQLSQAQVEEAHIAREWSSPQILEVDSVAVRSPQLALGPRGELYVVYAIALNEARGVFFTSSTDQGATWSDPVQVFDATASGWEMVDEPRLAIAADGTLHLLWNRYALPPNTLARSTHYSQSDDGGLSWTSETVIAEGVIHWSELLASDNQFVQRLWTQSQNDAIGFWYDTSLDGGLTWERAQQIQGLNNTTNNPAVDVDQEGLPHFILVTENGLQHLWWNRENWSSGDALRFQDENRELLAGSITSTAAVDINNHLTVLYVGEVVGADDQPAEYVVMSTTQDLQLPESDSPPSPTASPPAAPDPSATITASPTASPPPPSLPTTQIPAAGDGFPVPFLTNEDPILSLALSIIPVLLLVVIVVAVGLLRGRSRRR